MEVVVNKKQRVGAPGDAQGIVVGGGVKMEDLGGKRFAAGARSVLSMYREAPTQDVTLVQFEQLAMHRLKVLKTLEALVARKSEDDEKRAAVKKELKKQGLAGDADRDRVSHFILRLGFCRTEEHRRWLLDLEKDLFRLRFEDASHAEKQRFFQRHDMRFDPVQGLTEQQWRAIRTATFKFRDGEAYFRMPFLEALSLVRNRQVFVEAGFAFVRFKDIAEIVVRRFRAHLSGALAETQRAMQAMRSGVDRRILPLVNSLSKVNVGPQFKMNAVSGSITSKELPKLEKQGSLPLCMSRCYRSLAKERHLKHSGRMQFGLFLKGIGISLQDALAFWQRSFSPRTTADQFSKKYAYNIRHNYGREGKRADYTPYSCSKIISSGGGSSDNTNAHGCPFRYLTPRELRESLLRRKVGAKDVERIVELQKAGHFQVACSELFSATHEGSQPEQAVSNHPNTYFDASMAYISSKKAAAEQQQQQQQQQQQPTASN